ncbi:MAG: hypothetical protein ACR2MZ_04940 [Candidatus Dormibacter sp.]|uniref:hypothetical protein n=1 Tax=Candidatus Dormibacter sp. TaxID=2973982 RepID=UPI000DB539D9|nr:MAG: hypothetical protein DLM66_02990 [Candidatus Dormibacteraeota bacterium]
MIGPVRGEWLKAWRSPYLWTVGLLMVLVLLARGYGLDWFLMSQSPATLSPANIASYKQALAPAAFAQQALGNPGGVIWALEFVVGVLIFGSEYGWRTLAAMLMVGPSRATVFGAKTVVLAGIVVLLVLLRFVTALASSLISAVTLDLPFRLPSAGDVATAFAAACLIAITYASFGALLSLIFRRASIAYAVGLTYLFVFEDRAFGVIAKSSAQSLRDLPTGFPGPNSVALVHNLGGGTGSAVAASTGSGQAALVLAVYCLAALGVGCAILVRRDET